MLKVGPRELCEICNTIGHCGRLQPCCSQSFIYQQKPLFGTKICTDIKYLCIFLWTNFVRIHYLFKDANCELQGTDNVQGQIYEHIFPQNRGYCVYHPSNILQHTFENVYKQLSLLRGMSSLECFLIQLNEQTHILLLL